MSYRKFIILCPPRTGSTWLKRLLDQHPQIVTRGELFGFRKILGSGIDSKRVQMFHTRIRNMSMVSFYNRSFNLLLGGEPLNIVKERFANRNYIKAVGYKILYRHLEAPQWAGLSEKILDDKSIHIIHLTRENLLKRYVSEQIQKQTRISVIQKERHLQQTRLELTAEECLLDFQKIADQQNHYLKIFSSHPTIHITYEDLAIRHDKTLEMIYEFLGVEKLQVKASTRKINSDELKDIIINFNELEKRFANTEYEAWLK